MSARPQSPSFIELGGAKYEVQRRGKGRPLLLLAGEEQRELELALIDELAQRFDVIIPSPPGFGRSDRPDWITAIDDIAYIWLDLIERLALEQVTIVGFSLGGWLALEMATKDDSRIARMALVAPLGVKIGGPLDRDIQDIWTLHPDKVAALKWHEPTRARRDFSKMTEEELTIVARNSETFARYCWEPYMHNPKLRHRLGRVEVPTLMIWGESDGIVTPDYGKAYAELIPGARFTSIANAGHLPHMEQPAAFGKALTGFIG